MSLKVLVADDSIVFRRVIVEALGSLPDVEVLGSVSNGKLAVQRVRELRPDLLTLDMEMPEMDGMAVLDALRQAGAPGIVFGRSLDFASGGGHLPLVWVAPSRLRALGPARASHRVRVQRTADAPRSIG